MSMESEVLDRLEKRNIQIAQLQETITELAKDRMNAQSEVERLRAACRSDEIYAKECGRMDGESVRSFIGRISADNLHMREALGAKPHATKATLHQDQVQEQGRCSAQS